MRTTPFLRAFDIQLNYALVLTFPGYCRCRPGFYMLAAFRVLSLVVLYFVNISFRHSPSGSLFKYTLQLFKKVELSVLFLVMLLTGQCPEISDLRPVTQDVAVYCSQAGGCRSCSCNI